MSLEIRETIGILKDKGIDIALNMGEHTYCRLESNCPLAVKLRKMITDMGLTLAEIELLRAIEPEVDLLRRVEINTDRLQADLKVQIGDSTFQVNMKSMLKEEVQVALDRRMESIRDAENKIQSYGLNLQKVYMKEILATRNKKTLSIIGFSLEELHRTGIVITSDSTNSHYLIYAPFKYAPKLIYNDGETLELSKADQDILRREPVYILYTITKEYKCVRVDAVYDTGILLSHYHGSSTGGCWGHVQVLSTWDGTLKSIVVNAKLLERSLATVNYNSLLTRTPIDMPPAVELLSRAVKIGREGSIAQQVDTIAVDAETGDTIAPLGTTAAPPGGWGRVGTARA